MFSGSVCMDLFFCGWVRVPAMTRVLLAGAIILGIFTPLHGQEQAYSANRDHGPRELDSKPALSSHPEAEDYVILPDDVLQVDVFDVSEMSRQYRVSPSGLITLPLLPEPLQATGRTPRQLSGLISERLQTAGLVINPQVTVEVKESRVHSIAVTGAVKKPQIYPLFGRTTLLDVLSQAEGLTEEAGSTATIIRGKAAARMRARGAGEDGAEQEDSPDRIATVDLKRLLEAGDSSLNLDLYPGDRVTVQRSGIIYVVGAVNRPGGFPLKNSKEEMTVLKAVALAEDLKATGVRNKAIIIRKDLNLAGGRKEIPVNLTEVLAGRAPDCSLQAEDILFVPDSSSKKAIRRAAEAALQITTGVIIWRR